MAKKKAEPKTLEEQVEILLQEMTAPQREALLRRQLGLFDCGAVLVKGPTAGALRRKKLIGEQKRITELGAIVCERLAAA